MVTLGPGNRTGLDTEHLPAFETFPPATDFRAHPFMHRRIAHDPFGADFGTARFELRLDERDSPASGLAQGKSRGQYRTQPDKAGITDHDRNRARDKRGVQKSRVCFSITTTRGSERSFQAIWPCPTSTAKTLLAPLVSRTSVKPPVDAPTSIAVAPVGFSAKWLKAWSSFKPPRDTQG